MNQMRNTMQRKKNLKTLLLSLAMMTLFGLISNAQPVVKTALVEELKDGSLIVTIDNKSYRALPPEKMREIIANKQKLVLAEERVTSLTEQFNVFRQAVETDRLAAEAVFNTKLQNAFDNRDHFQKQFEKE